MGEKVEISIVIPVFNGVNFINDAYNNILNQNLKSFEIIFVDNNSVDNSVEIIQKLIAVDTRVKYYTEKKQGAASARNMGIKKSLGEFIYFFDVDDFVLNGALNKMILTLKEIPTASSVFGMISQNKISNYNYEQSEIMVKSAPYWGEKWFESFASLSGTPSFLHKKETVLSNNGFPEQLLLGEDAAFHIKLGLEKKLIFLKAPVYFYNRHNSSTTLQEKRRISLSEKYYIQYCKYYLPKVLNNEKPFDIIKVDVFKNTLGSLGRVLVEKKTMKERYDKYEYLKKKLGCFSIPILIKINYFFIIVFGSKLLHKIILARLLKLIYY